MIREQQSKLEIVAPESAPQVPATAPGHGLPLNSPELATEALEWLWLSPLPSPLKVKRATKDAIEAKTNREHGPQVWSSDEQTPGGASQKENAALEPGSKAKGGVGAKEGRGRQEEVAMAQASSRAPLASLQPETAAAWEWPML